MASNTLGRGGKTLVTALYLFIYGATLTAYMAEGANFMNMALTGEASQPATLVVLRSGRGRGGAAEGDSQ
jgi:hypothetical protein